MAAGWFLGTICMVLCGHAFCQLLVAYEIDQNVTEHGAHVLHVKMPEIPICQKKTKILAFGAKLNQTEIRTTFNNVTNCKVTPKFVKCGLSTVECKPGSTVNGLIFYHNKQYYKASLKNITLSNYCDAVFEERRDGGKDGNIGNSHGKLIQSKGDNSLPNNKKTVKKNWHAYELLSILHPRKVDDYRDDEIGFY